MLAQPRRAARSRIVAIAPVFQRHHGDPELATLVGQHVVEAMLSPAVRSTDQHALRHEVIQAIGEDVAGDTEALLEALEPADAEHGVTKDEQGPALPDDLEGTGDRADLVGIPGVQHSRMVARVSCITQLMW